MAGTIYRLRTAPIWCSSIRFWDSE